MQEWYSALSTFEQIYWGVALIASLFFVFVLVSTLLGGDTDEFDTDAEIESDTGADFQFFSFKNLVAFFTIFGWTGIGFIGSGYSTALVVVLSIVCGLVMMFIMGYLVLQMNKMTSSGTLKMENAVNQLGEVYLTIGANRSTMGKVQISVQGSLRELDALTDADVSLKSHTVIRVTEVTPNGILIVTPTK
jgi:hypothetical protein